MRRLFAAAVIAAMGVAGVSGLAGKAFAESTVSSKARNKLFAAQTKLLDKRAAVQYSNSSRLKPNSEKTTATLSTSARVPGYRGAYKGPYLQLARDAARKHGVPEELFLRLVQQESGWRSNARSHKGAIGLAQLMPGTAARLGVNPHDPQENLEGGARYLRMMYDRYSNWRTALAAYNAGPAAVDKHGGIPPYRETTQYVRTIFGS